MNDNRTRRTLTRDELGAQWGKPYILRIRTGITIIEEGIDRILADRLAIGRNDAIGLVADIYRYQRAITLAAIHRLRHIILERIFITGIRQRRYRHTHATKRNGVPQQVLADRGK